MSWKTRILVVICLLLVIGCTQEGSNEKTNESVQEYFLAPESKVATDHRRMGSTFGEPEYIDSLRLALVLNEALDVANSHFNSDSWNETYEAQPDDSSYVIHVDITYGNLLSETQKHLLIRRGMFWGVYLNLYAVSDDVASSLIEDEQLGMTYINDTIFDVNGDKELDFLVHWYPSSGCCRRDVYNVYLNQSTLNSFTDDYEFINPTFSAEESIVRGVEYGHPTEAGLYKYRWNGLQVDTIEFIYHDLHKKGRYIRTEQKSYRPSEKEGVVITRLPNEYLNINSIDWFGPIGE